MYVLQPFLLRLPLIAWEYKRWIEDLLDVNCGGYSTFFIPTDMIPISVRGVLFTDWKEPLWWPEHLARHSAEHPGIYTARAHSFPNI